MFLNTLADIYMAIQVDVINCTWALENGEQTETTITRFYMAVSIVRVDISISGRYKYVST